MKILKVECDLHRTLRKLMHNLRKTYESILGDLGKLALAFII